MTRFYANYELTEDGIEPEYKLATVVFQVVAKTLKRRYVYTKTWEATIPDLEVFPGISNPGNLSEREGWRCHSCKCTKSLSVPLSKHIVETWVKEGDWEVIDYWEE